MKIGHVIAIFVVVFCSLSLYAHHLKVQVALQESKLALAKSENDQLVDTEYSLKKDIQRAKQLQTDINNELERENETYQLLQETLKAIQSKLKGSERLQHAVSSLEKEYGELVIEAKMLEETRK